MQGSCLCKKVRYQVTGPVRVFQYCHCSRCRKFTGSAHASNIFVKPEQFSWITGEEHVGRFEPEETKYFATSFCQRCGSSLPWYAKGGKNMIIPAGTLDDEVPASPQQNIYWDSKATWYVETCDLVKYAKLPERK